MTENANWVKLSKELKLTGVLAGVQGITLDKSSAKTFSSYSPIDSRELGQLVLATNSDYEQLIEAQQETFQRWRQIPAPQRGMIVREVADAIRAKREQLGELISWEMGKIKAEGIGEVQEVIDIADFAVGLSRQLYGKSMHSERPAHRMYEQWHPLGIVGVITAFNFPMAVWGWNAMLGAVCGDVILWKPSEHTPLCAIALNSICSEVAARHGFPALFGLIIGDGPEFGQKIAADERIPLVSATGSCRMGRSVAEVVGRRLGRSLLELGGNNAIIVLKDANLDLVIRSTVFGAVGTAGQRCTSTRRVLIEKEIVGEFTDRMLKAYRQVKIGNPLEDGTLMGPLINKQAVQAYQNAITKIKEQGGEILCGAELVPGMPSDLYVRPTLVKAQADLPILQEEVFAPILYIIPVENVDQAIAVQNAVPQGLSSAIFTNNVQSAEKFLSVVGSDCGIANVNLGTSGAEIGGAFGGEKETGGGREAGSDSWKQYMRRQTNTINWGKDLPLAQGISFDL